MPLCEVHGQRALRRHARIWWAIVAGYALLGAALVVLVALELADVWVPFAYMAGAILAWLEGIQRALVVSLAPPERLTKRYAGPRPLR